MRGPETRRSVPAPGRGSTAGTGVRPPLPDLWRPAGSARVFVPQGYEPGYDYPLLVWLADPANPGDLGRAMARTSLRNFVAVQPAAGADPEARTWQAVESVRERYSIHPRRVYLVGEGAGGTTAFRIGCRAPEAFGGVVSLGGAFPLDEGLFAAAARVRRLPMLLCLRQAAAAADPGSVDAVLRLFHAAGATLSLRLYPDRAAAARAMLADVNRWLMEDVCRATPAAPARCAP